MFLDAIFRYTPFAHGAEDNATQILKRIGEEKLVLSGGNWDTVSDSAKNLVRNMLHINPGKRCTAKQVHITAMYTLYTPGNVYQVATSLWR